MLFALCTKPVGEVGVSELLIVIPNRNGERFLGPDQHNESSGTSNRGVHQISLEKKIVLDRDEGVNEFWRMKAWTDRMTSLGGKDSSVLVHQFVGNRLEGIRFLR